MKYFSESEGIYVLGDSLCGILRIEAARTGGEVIKSSIYGSRNSRQVAGVSIKQASVGRFFAAQTFFQISDVYCPPCKRIILTILTKRLSEGSRFTEKCSKPFLIL